MIKYIKSGNTLTILENGKQLEATKDIIDFCNKESSIIEDIIIFDKNLEYEDDQISIIKEGNNWECFYNGKYVTLDNRYMDSFDVLIRDSSCFTKKTFINFIKNMVKNPYIKPDLFWSEIFPYSYSYASDGNLIFLRKPRSSDFITEHPILLMSDIEACSNIEFVLVNPKKIMPGGRVSNSVVISKEHEAGTLFNLKLDNIGNILHHNAVIDASLNIDDVINLVRSSSLNDLEEISIKLNEEIITDKILKTAIVTKDFISIIRFLLEKPRYLDYFREKS